MRFGFFTSAVVACLLLCGGRALAGVEYCPATLETVGHVNGDPANIIRFVLRADTPRSVQGQASFFADGDWYTAPFANAALTVRHQHYDFNNTTFVRRDFASSEQFVRFPDAAHVIYAYVSEAMTLNGGLDWDTRGELTCPPAPSFSLAPASIEQLFPDGPRLADPPVHADLPFNEKIAEAKQASPPGRLDCLHPFQDATVKNIRRPDFPSSIGDTLRHKETVVVLVSVAPDGSLDDASIWAPSRYPEFDAAALQAAEASTYSAGAAFCAPAEGQYLFRADFLPN